MCCGAGAVASACMEPPHWLPSWKPSSIDLLVPGAHAGDSMARDEPSAPPADRPTHPVDVLPLPHERVCARPVRRLDSPDPERQRSTTLGFRKKRPFCVAISFVRRWTISIARKPRARAENLLAKPVDE